MGAGSGVMPRPQRSSRWPAALRCSAGCSRCFLLALASIWVFLRGADRRAAGRGHRVIFIHVPAAWMAMVIYLRDGVLVLLGLVLGTRLSFMMSHALAPTGGACSVDWRHSGGRPTWGHLLVWDARLTSTLILFFLYVGYMALAASFDDKKKGDRTQR